MISAAENNLRMAADTQLLELQYLDHKCTICMAFMPGNQFFDVAQHYPERRLLFLSQGLNFKVMGSTPVEGNAIFHYLILA